MPKYVALKTIQVTGKNGSPEFVAPGETFDMAAKEGSVLVDMGAAELVSGKKARKQEKGEKKGSAPESGDEDPFAVDDGADGASGAA